MSGAGDVQADATTSQLRALHRAGVRPAARALATLNAGAALLIMMSDPPRSSLSDGARSGLVAALFLLSVAAPLVVSAVVPRRVGIVTAMFGLALLASSIVLDVSVRVPFQGVLSLPAVIIGLAMTTLGLIVLAGGRQARPVTCKL